MSGHHPHADDADGTPAAAPGAVPAGSDDDVVLSVRDLEVAFGTKRGTARVVRGLDYDLRRGETLAIVGESGSGKSVSTLALTKLIPMPPGRVTGTAHLGDVDLIALSEQELLAYRGRRIGFVFQDPMTSLNPVHTIGRQLTEGMRHHLQLSRADARDRAVELLRRSASPAPNAASTTTPTSSPGDAPAGRDRDRAVVRSGGAGRRRGHHRARRHHPGTDRRPGRSAAGRPRDGGDLDHPRPRRRRRHRRPGARDVRRRGGRGGGRRRAVRAAAPPLHRGAARVPAGARRPRPRRADRDPGAAAVADRPAAGLLVPPALHLPRRRAVRARASAPARGRAGHRVRSFYTVPDAVARRAAASERIAVEPPDVRDQEVAP
jgi:hypothetical protein